jgi:hypothetical protein
MRHLRTTGTMDNQKSISALDSINPQARGVVSAFLDEALSAFSGDIVAYVLTGSCVTADFVPGKSDINGVLVLKDMCPPCLDSLAAMGRRHGKKGLRAPLIMTPEYIQRSLDVFPMEFLDIKLIHATVYGPELFSNICVSKPLLRLQCERELKAKLIRLLNGYVAAMGKGRELEALLLGAYPGYYPLFRGMLTLAPMNGKPAILKDDVLREMESAFSVPLGCLRDVRAMGHKRGFFHDWSTAKRVFEHLYKATNELSLIMDRIAA